MLPQSEKSTGEGQENYSAFIHKVDAIPSRDLRDHLVPSLHLRKLSPDVVLFQGSELVSNRVGNKTCTGVLNF